MALLRRNGNEPPTLMKVRANMFVAIATCSSIPKAIITGTVIRDVLPVATLMMLVRKKTITRASSCAVGIAPIINEGAARVSIQFDKRRMHLIGGASRDRLPIASCANRGSAISFLTGQVG
jgi:hypothetical protein